MQYDAVILAGGQSSGELKKIAPYDNEALIIIGKYPMIYYVYKALRNSEHINRIVICGPVESLKSIFVKDENLYLAGGGENAVDSLANGVELLKGMGISERLLILPSDIPFITTEAIDDFINQAEAVGADFVYPLTSKEVNEAKYPGVRRTYAKLKDGIFTGGNLFVITSAVIDQGMDMAKKLVERRKNPLSMARLFGPLLVWKFITRSLSIREVEKRFYEIIGIKARAIISAYAEVGVDVDKPSDLELANRYLADVRL